MPISVTWLPLRDIWSSILIYNYLYYNHISTLTDQLLFRPNNTFDHRLLDIGNKFEKIGNKTANNKRKKKDELKGFKFIATIITIIRSRAKAVIYSGFLM